MLSTRMFSGLFRPVAKTVGVAAMAVTGEKNQVAPSPQTQASIMNERPVPVGLRGARTR